VIRCATPTYDDKRLPSLSEMHDIAWNIHSRNRGQVGFVGGDKMQVVIEPPAKIGTEGEPPQHGLATKDEAE
jgi:hypothetical protein